VAQVDLSTVTGNIKLDGTPGEELATFGAGCYWGTEKFFVSYFEQHAKGALLGYGVGFMSPDITAPANPSYTFVCTNTTTHVEVFHFRYDSTKVSFEELVRFFYTFHDPTTKNRQGNDQGIRYSSTIFYHNKN
jgi:peptide-methionine (S)-S-oxide reductase